MSLRLVIQFVMVMAFPCLNTIYACDFEELTSIHKHAAFIFVKKYAPDTLPLKFFEELAKNGKTSLEDITYSVTDQSATQKFLPKNLLVSDGICGQRDALEIKRLTTIPCVDLNDSSKLILEYAYKGRWFSGQQKITFYAHLEDLLDEKFVQQWTKTLEGFEIHYREDETLIATLSLDEGNEEKIEPTLLKKVSTAVQFVAPYVLNDVAQTFAPKLVPPEVLVSLNTLSAKSGFDTPLHALMPQNEAQKLEIDSLDQKRKELSNTSEAIGAALTFVPGATKVRTAVNLAFQYAGYDSATHWWYGVPAKMLRDTPEENSYQQKINLAKGTARLAIIMFVPGGKFIIIGSKIYEFVAGKSLTQAVVEKFTPSSSQEDKN